MVLDVLYFRLILLRLQCCCSRAIESKDKVEKYEEEEILMALTKYSRLITNCD